MRALVVALFALALAAPAHAQDRDFRNGLADLLASEEVCGLSYDQAALARLVSDRVAADDVSFTDDVASLSGFAKYRLDSMGASARTVHCTQIARLAAEFGLTK